MSRRLLFRVDAGDRVGLGHFYRSVNLAQYLKGRGHYIEFIHRPSLFWNTLNDFCFSHQALSPEEEEFTLEKISGEDIDLFYVDGMTEFSESFIKRVKKKAKVVFYQNLTLSKALADTFILPSIHQNGDFFKDFPGTTKVYSGLEYFTFNEEIAGFSRKTAVENQPVSRIGVIAGGSDPKNILLTVSSLLKQKLPKGISVTCYYGQSYQHSGRLPAETLAADSSLTGKHVIRFEPYDIARILENDILIATFGVSAYEFMYLGMPIISIAHQESNHAAAKVIAEQKKAVFDLGLIDDLDVDKLSEAVQKLASDPGLRRNLSENGKKCLDLNGIQRVTEIIENA